MTKKAQKGWLKLYPAGLFVRDYLLRHKTAYAQQIWRELKEFRKKLKVRTGTHYSFYCNVIYPLIKLGLVRVVKEEITQDNFFERKRTWIELTEKGLKESEEVWRNPLKALLKYKNTKSKSQKESSELNS